MSHTRLPLVSRPARPSLRTAIRFAASGVAICGLVLAFALPSAQPQAGQMVVASRAAEPVISSKAPDVYPWVRPLSSAALPEGLTRWSPAIKPRTGGFFTRLGQPLADPVFVASDHGNTGSFYGGDWVPANITARDGGAFLEVRRTPERSLPYTAAEMKTEEHYGYGRYEAIMQPARGSGLVTAFFTFTGEPFGDPHDEIDIEFVGTDTTKIHFNYFRNGKSIKPATFDLPFDAAAAPRLYAFEWRPEGITWFVDGEPIYATEAGDTKIPVTPGKVMFSAWTGSPKMAGWHGKPVFRNGSGGQFNCVSYTPLGHDTPSCADTYFAENGEGARGTP